MAKLVFADCNNEYYFSTNDLTEEQLEEIEVIFGDAKVILRRILNLTNPQLKWIQTFSAGVDYLPMTELLDRQILLSNASGVHAEPIAETTFGTILAHFRGIKQSFEKQLSKDWRQAGVSYKIIRGKKMVVIGTGHIGEWIGKLGQAFGMTTIGINHSGHSVPGFKKTMALDQLAAAVIDAYVLVNALPLTDETRNFYDKQFFTKLTAAPMFINIGRGPSVVTTDLIAALNQGKLSAASLDVTDPEPLPPDSPLWQMKNVLITPHISGIYQEYAEDVIQIFQENLEQYRQDRTLSRNKVDLDRGY
ncbi:NAD(P)-dependent oxidoreductase [Lactiplantibacillus plantarum]|uniref:NAD(P)-dependent oxidoreductase n=1 Tax=Lactiplantibacillus plantarum TaxID=1590 RepID=UPI001F4C6310|nr:NAD(P)-dependent oxidoreductase [Lactiplantibacillus plantarum]MCH8632429.1 hydroxyacid dehydrogenase [Lactiplantibacillus plantarum]MCH8635477.1 hydroxyacid dehydrogenase [Lactiplantibacillus plantarum]MCT4452116.1 hydroxyacid dehydrogenase [Lactiplantibacillus plantarum]MCT4459740.1 hydroxyacid dehydrogenase [Lactiplantibacillus plantarum]